MMRQVAIITEEKETETERKQLKKQLNAYGVRMEQIANKYYHEIKSEVTFDMINSVEGEDHMAFIGNKAIITLLKGGRHLISEWLITSKRLTLTNLYSFIHLHSLISTTEEFEEFQVLFKNNESNQPSAGSDQEMGVMIERLLRMFWLEMRNRDNVELLEIVGDEKLYNITLRLITAVERHLSFLGSVNLSTFVIKILDIFKALVDQVVPKTPKRKKKPIQGGSSSGSLDEEQANANTTAAYDRFLDDFTNVIYGFGREVLIADAKEGNLKMVAEWFLKKVKTVRRNKAINVREDVLKPG